MKKKKYLIRRIVAILFIFLLGITIFTIYKIDSNKSNDKFIPKKVSLNFQNRINDLKIYQYEDYFTIGWLQVQGTNIDFPILDVRSSGIVSEEINFGWRSPYYESGKNHEVLLGHNIVNVSSTPIRDMTNLRNFEGLMAFTYEDFAKENLYINYTKGESIETYKIYAIGFYDYGSGVDDNLSSDEVMQYISNAKKNSLYDYNLDVNQDDWLLTIKTCTRYFGANEKQQLIIDARRVRENESIETYEVTTNDNYNILSNGVTNEKG